MSDPFIHIEFPGGKFKDAVITATGVPSELAALLLHEIARGMEASPEDFHHYDNAEQREAHRAEMVAEIRAGQE